MEKRKLSYKVKGEKKKRQKQAELPNDAKKIKCNKKPGNYKGKYGVKVKYNYKGENREKVFPVPKGASNITLR